MQSITTRPWLYAVLTLALAGLPVAGCQAADKAGKTVLAVIDGKTITESDVTKASAEEFQALEREYAHKRYDLMQSGLDQLIDQRLIALEAAKRGTSEEEVLASIESKPVSDADVDQFYEQNQSRIRGTKEQMAPQIRQYLEQLNAERAHKAFVAQLRSQHSVDYRLEPERIEVAANGPAVGPDKAPVTIVEFADFQCPYCARIAPTLKQVRDTYGDKVRLVYRQFPLSIHNNAQTAAEASLCAYEQGKFWELHDRMFADQRALSADQLKASAADLGLDAEAFNSCLDSNRFAAEIASDTSEGSAAGVTGTPALFVNGRFISGAVPLDQITTVVDDELRRHGVKTAQN